MSFLVLPRRGETTPDNSRGPTSPRDAPTSVTLDRGHDWSQTKSRLVRGGRVSDWVRLDWSVAGVDSDWIRDRIGLWRSGFRLGQR